MPQTAFLLSLAHGFEPAPGGRAGVCTSLGSPASKHYEVWLKTMADCEAKCSGMTECTAYEWLQFGTAGGYRRCELQTAQVNGILPAHGFVCMVKRTNYKKCCEIQVRQAAGQ